MRTSFVSSLIFLIYCNTNRRGFELWLSIGKIIVLCATDLSSSCSYCFHQFIGFHWLKVEVDSCPML